MLTLLPSQRRALRARAHHLHPLVMIGESGLTPAVLHEVDRALKNHDLLKIRVLSADRDSRHEMLNSICETLGAGPVQSIGKMLVVFRPLPEAASNKTRAAASRRKQKTAPRRTKRSYQGS